MDRRETHRPLALRRIPFEVSLAACIACTAPRAISRCALVALTPTILAFVLNIKNHALVVLSCEVHCSTALRRIDLGLPLAASMPFSTPSAIPRRLFGALAPAILALVLERARRAQIRCLCVDPELPHHDVCAAIDAGRTIQHAERDVLPRPLRPRLASPAVRARAVHRAGAAEAAEAEELGADALAAALEVSAGSAEPGAPRRRRPRRALDPQPLGQSVRGPAHFDLGDREAAHGGGTFGQRSPEDQSLRRATLRRRAWDNELRSHLAIERLLRRSWC
mmetsp:Transcript_77230/g.201016  ORF Transcript_77230/g.201016 Transcript_77230/m.201016 type:complete len:279 (+) Transcript_77230:378-1214(+)